MARKSKRKNTTGRKSISKGRDIWNRMTRNANAVIGMVIVVILVLVAIFADQLVERLAEHI